MNVVDGMRSWAQNHRGKMKLGPNNPIVKIAKRYCMRKDIDWDVGMAGHCELGKRVIKQVAYELTDPLRQAWNKPWGKVLIIGAPLVLILLVLTLFSWQGVLIALAVLLGVAMLLFGLVSFGMGADEYADDLPDLSRMDRLNRALAILMVYSIGAPFYWAGRLGAKAVNSILQSSNRYAKPIAGWALGTVVVTGLILLSVFVNGAWKFALGFAIGILALFGMFYLANVVADMVQKYAHRKLQDEAVALAKDENAQVAAFATLEPTLRKWYEDDYLGLRYWLKPSAAFEEMVECIRSDMELHGHVWTDLLSPRYDRAMQRYTAFEYLEGTVEYGYWNLIYRIHGLVVGQRKLEHQQRWQGLRDVGEFISASWFLAKTRVCMMVDLPKWDEVDASK